MASPPAKRQRRSKAVFSDDEEEPETPRRETTSRRSVSSTATSATNLSEAQKHPKLTGANSKSKRSTATRQAALKSESTSPSKSKKSPRKKRTEENSKSLHSFFGRASEEQRWTRKADTPSEEIGDVENGDAIEDDDDNSPEKDFSQLAKRQEDVKFQLDRRKGGVTLTQHGSQTSRTGLPASTHKFVKPPVPSINKNGTKFELEDSSKLHRPWADRYSPSSLEELAVHKKKAADVQNWLCGVLTGRNPHVCAKNNILPSLILTGP
jgi:cell cycle checkpoint protein